MSLRPSSLDTMAVAGVVMRVIAQAVLLRRLLRRAGTPTMPHRLSAALDRLSRELAVCIRALAALLAAQYGHRLPGAHRLRRLGGVRADAAQPERLYGRVAVAIADAETLLMLAATADPNLVRRAQQHHACLVEMQQQLAAADRTDSE